MPSKPYSQKGKDSSLELSLVCGDRRVYPIIRVLPDDGIFDLLMKVDIIYFFANTQRLRIFSLIEREE